LGAHLPNILGALALLVAGWIIAVVVRAGSIRLLALLKVNQRIRESTDQTINIESGIAGIFWVILLVTMLGVLNALDLELVSDPFQVLVSQIFGYLPRLVAGTVLVIIAWLIATVLRTLASRLIAKTTWDEKLSAQAGMEPMSKNVGNVLFWLVILLFIPAILGTYALEGLLAPVQSPMYLPPWSSVLSVGWWPRFCAVWWSICWLQPVPTRPAIKPVLNNRYRYHAWPAHWSSFLCSFHR
jgi:hypothetical protein